MSPELWRVVWRKRRPGSSGEVDGREPTSDLAECGARRSTVADGRLSDISRLTVQPFSLYTKSLNVALQAITLISISVLADIRTSPSPAPRHPAANPPPQSDMAQPPHQIPRNNRFHPRKPIPPPPHLTPRITLPRARARRRLFGVYE